MPNQYHTHWTTPIFIKKMLEHQEPYSVLVQDQEIIIHPGVFSPYYDWSSDLMIKHLPDLKGKAVLEIGSGTGVISLFVHLNGAAFIMAVDINPKAVENTISNLEHHGVRNFKCCQSDVFSNITGKFDLIIFNAPYHGNKPANMIERAVSDENYQSLTKFIDEASNFLEPDGEIMLEFSESGDTALMRNLLDKNNLQIIWMKEDFRKGYNAQLYLIRPKQK